MPRYALGIEYDGRAYAGWQRQHHATTVQGELEKAVATIAAGPIDTHCAGRTDTGVHATGQVVHLDVDRPATALTLGITSHLPPDIAVRWAQQVPPNFHARFDAVERRYRYLIRSSRTRSALFAGRAFTVHENLDAERMHAAAQALVGEHDFSAFRAAGCQARHPRREVRRIAVREHEHWIIVDIAANAFLQHMVRNIVGLLAAVGANRLPVLEVARVLATRDRRESTAAAPAAGLYLTQVLYPEHFDLPQPGALDDALPPVLPLIAI